MDTKTIHQNLDEIEIQIRSIKLILDDADALKVESEKEMLLIRVNRLENELRRIKEHLKIT